MDTKIKSDEINIGGNIRRIRIARGVRQTDLTRMLQLKDVSMTREALVKIERGTQHISASQLCGIRDCLETTYEELLKK